MSKKTVREMPEQHLDDENGQDQQKGGRAHASPLLRRLWLGRRRWQGSLPRAAERGQNLLAQARVTQRK
jgi:hypothetical protein